MENDIMVLAPPIMQRLLLEGTVNVLSPILLRNPNMNSNGPADGYHFVAAQS